MKNSEARPGFFILANYYFDMIALPIASVAVILWAHGQWQLDWSWMQALIYLLGFLSFSLIEYIFHRFLYHSRWRLVTSMHLDHHAHPQKKIAAPFIQWVLTSFFLFHFYQLFVSPAVAACFLAGNLMGYEAYTVLHHLMHHHRFHFFPLSVLQASHDRHHQRPKSCFGVTSPFWDYVFQTQAKGKEASQ